MTGVISILFYKSVWGLILAIVIVPWSVVQFRGELAQKREKRIHFEFKELMILLSNSLQAGYSLEKGLFLAEKELSNLFAGKCLLKEPIHMLNQKIKMNISLENAFREFADEIGIEDAKNIADIIGYSKRMGGDYSKHIRNTAIRIDEKMQVQQEIDTMTTEKRLELKVMTAMPMGILAYVSITSGDFIAPLYGSTLGILVMTGCLAMYLGMYTLGKKIVEIRI